VKQVVANDAGIVDEDMKTAALTNNPIDRPKNLGPIAYIRSYTYGAASERRCHLYRRLLIDVKDSHPGSVISKPLGYCSANPLTATRYQRDSIANTRHCFSSMKSCEICAFAAQNAQSK
jgi:hypothetical protein